MPKWFEDRVGRFRGRLYATDRARDFDHENDRNVRRKQIYDTIDRQPYQWIVVLVAGIGFFLDGYTLFVANIALPMISYVYWRDDTSSLTQAKINIATLAGTLLGQVVFGILADKYGRKKMYGIELITVICATLGVAMSSNGAHDSMDVFSWLIWWRIVVGIGVGADYPLSAVITSEFAPTAKRARMMASVFFMQPLGQVLGNVVSILVITGFRNKSSTATVRAVDQMWRWVIGIGVVPGVIALFFRIVIPETPRFILEIEDDPIKAEFDATQLFGESGDNEDSQSLPTPVNHSSISFTVGPNRESIGTPTTIETNDYFANYMNPATLNSKWGLTKADIHQYFWIEGNWRTLAGTSLSWLLLDFAFYGIGFSNPHFLAKTWGNLHVGGKRPIWQTDDRPGANVYDMFFNSSTEALLILNAGSFTGAILLIVFAGRLNRVSLQKWGFLFLAALFIALGVVFIVLGETGAFAITLYVIGQLAFNFGPNGTTFILPAELYPTRYRASCHGISAGSGKLGSILVQIFSAYYSFGGDKVGKEETRRYGRVLIVLSAAMVLGAVVTHLWVPDVQYKDQHQKSKTLEVLARGRMGHRARDDFKRQWNKVFVKDAG